MSLDRHLVFVSMGTGLNPNKLGNDSKKPYFNNGQCPQGAKKVERTGIVCTSSLNPTCGTHVHTDPRHSYLPSKEELRDREISKG